jgi:hypothetical protein
MYCGHEQQIKHFDEAKAFFQCSFCTRRNYVENLIETNSLIAETPEEETIITKLSEKIKATPELIRKTKKLSRREEDLYLIRSNYWYCDKCHTYFPKDQPLPINTGDKFLDQLHLLLNKQFAESEHSKYCDGQLIDASELIKEQT